MNFVYILGISLQLSVPVKALVFARSFPVGTLPVDAAPEKAPPVSAACADPLTAPVFTICYCLICLYKYVHSVGTY